MPLAPWTEQSALAPGAPEKVPPKKKGWTWPWEEEHWAKVSKEAGAPGWLEPTLKAGWTGGLTTLGALLPGMGMGLAGGGAFGTRVGVGALDIAQKAPWLTKLLGGIGGVSAYGMGQTPGQVPGQVPGQTPGPYFAPGYTPTGGVPEWLQTPSPTTFPDLPMPGEGEEAMGPAGQPQIVEVGGQTFWWNPTGGIYGTGGWDLIPARAEPIPRLSVEQQLAEAKKQRGWEATQAAAAQAKQMKMLQAQIGAEQQAGVQQAEFERQAMAQQAGYTREQQQTAAAQQMGQMFAADPYKYWAQMGQGTPEAVARLTGGQVAPGEQMQPGTPMSMPSAQWWGGLLPSEQQQIAGGLNWMGVDPQDWYSMYQRMIPGLGQRQAGPVWAR